MNKLTGVTMLQHPDRGIYANGKPLYEAPEYDLFINDLLQPHGGVILTGIQYWDDKTPRVHETILVDKKYKDVNMVADHLYTAPAIEQAFGFARRKNLPLYICGGPDLYERYYREFEDLYLMELKPGDNSLNADCFFPDFMDLFVNDSEFDSESKMLVRHNTMFKTRHFIKDA